MARIHTSILQVRHLPIRSMGNDSYVIITCLLISTPRAHFLVLLLTSLLMLDMVVPYSNPTAVPP